MQAGETIGAAVLEPGKGEGEVDLGDLELFGKGRTMVGDDGGEDLASLMASVAVAVTTADKASASLILTDQEVSS